MAEDGKFSVMFRKGMIDSGPDLFRYDSIKELINYVNNKDANIEMVKILIIKANRELKMRHTRKQLYVRKAQSNDKCAENRICMTNR